MSLTEMVKWLGRDGAAHLWRACMTLALLGIALTLWDVRDTVYTIQANISHLEYHLDQADIRLQRLEDRERSQSSEGRRR